MAVAHSSRPVYATGPMRASKRTFAAPFRCLASLAIGRIMGPALAVNLQGRGH